MRNEKSSSEKGKTFAAFFCAGILLCGAGACAPKSPYEGASVVRIERISWEGMEMFSSRRYIRAFDFENNIVTDETELSEEDFQTWISLYEERTPDATESEREAYIAELAAEFNTPEVKARFSEADEKDFFEYVEKQGFYSWAERYETQLVVDDGAGFLVKIYFAGQYLQADVFLLRLSRQLRENSSRIPKRSRLRVVVSRFLYV